MSETPSRSSAPLQVILMFAIILATILLGFFMMPSSKDERDKLLGELGTTNHGMLLDPVRQITDLPLRDDSGAPWRWQDQKPKWRLLIPSGTRCEGECADLLFVTRQVHVRLAKYSNRIERVYVALDGAIDPSLAQDLEKNHPYLRVLHGGRSEFSRWLEGTNSGWRDGKAEAILVDPAGVAMMVYDARHNGNDMLEDINHLLKYSPE